MSKVLDSFSLKNKVCIITGGAGLLGTKHTEAIIEAGGIPIIFDINEEKIKNSIGYLNKKYNKKVLGLYVDITSKDALEEAKRKILRKYHKIDVLINNAANNPKLDNKPTLLSWSRVENFPLEVWNQDINVGLTGAFLTSQVFGTEMANKKHGVILNISSDLGLIAPDQRIYRKEGLMRSLQPVKPVTYPVVKHAIIGLTRYLATYWADKGIRVNALCPGGVYNNQDTEFVKKLTNLIPMGRMAEKDEYKATVIYLISDASSYMTGSVVLIDGGRTSW
jgi:NAD(P)-dependent dehydrogenase (short-subunit alcohol dehydrogenase family)